MFGFLASGLASVLFKPVIQPLAYAKHWGAVGGALATLFGASLGADLGITDTQMQGFLAVIGVVAVNLIPNRA